MPVLQIKLLGQFRLSYGDHPVTGLDSPRPQELVAFLVLHSDSPLSRQRLAFLFWPDSTEAQAHTNLRNLYHHLRQELPDADRFLQATATALRWQADSSYTLDVAEFESGIDRATTAEDLVAVVRLYRGELLPGCYSDWVLAERERLGLKFAQTLARLIDLLSERQDYRAGIGYAQILLRSDPLREETYREIMRLSALSGDRAGVARTFNACKTVLTRQLAVEPSPETQAAYVKSLAEAGKPRAASRPAISPSHGRRHNLPLVLSRFFGREEELTSIQHLVMTNRLVTLTGAAGVGKTRLALAVAERVVESFPDGVWVVDLAPLTDPAHVASALASALGVREMPGQSLNERLGEYVRGRKLIILFDNCEHLAPAAASLVETCLRAAPESRSMATSREVLGIDGEQVWRVQPLPLPDSILYEPRGTGHGMTSVPGERIVSRLLECPSVQLFVDRASTTLPSFVLSNESAAAVAQICRRLDGIPLAIELAAGRINLMTAEEIQARLDNEIGLLGGGSPRVLPHHRTLRAAIDWSYETLSEKERRLLRRLAVFVGGFTVYAAEQVTSDRDLPFSEILESLSSLADKSLVTLEAHDGETHLRLLEPIRQYAWEKLIAVGEADQMRARHLGYFLDLAEELDGKTQGPEQAAALRRLRQEHDNFRAALSWSIEADAEKGLRLAAALNPLWEYFSYVTEGRTWLERLLSLNRIVEPTVRARALYSAAGVAFFHGDVVPALSLFESSLELYRGQGNQRMVADILARIGVILFGSNDFGGARPRLEESLAIAQTEGDTGGLAFPLLYLGYLLAHLGECDRGHALLERGLSLSCELGAPGFTGIAYLLLGYLAREEGDLVLARDRQLEGLAVCKRENLTVGLVYGLDALGIVEAEDGRFQRAARLLAAAARIGKDTGTALILREQMETDQSIRLARSELGEGDFAAAWAEGDGMSREEALALALGADS